MKFFLNLKKFYADFKHLSDINQLKSVLTIFLANQKINTTFVEFIILILFNSKIIKSELKL